MTNPFTDQADFMQACGQTTNEYNKKQYSMYRDLIIAELNELDLAVVNNDRVEQLDALIDILAVVIGAMHSMGADAEGAWKEVLRTNFAKIDPSTGAVIRRNDGKILKPDGWQPPNLDNYVK